MNGPRLRLQDPESRSALLQLWRAGGEGLRRDAWALPYAIDLGYAEVFQFGGRRRLRLTESGLVMVATLLLPKE